MTAATLTTDQIRTLVAEMVELDTAGFVFREQDQARGFRRAGHVVDYPHDVSMVSDDIALIYDRAPLDDDCTQWGRVTWLVRRNCTRVLRLNGDAIIDPQSGDTLSTIVRQPGTYTFRATNPAGRVLAKDEGLYGCLARVARVHLHATARADEPCDPIED